MADDDNEGLPGLPGSVDVSADDVDKLAKLPLRAQQIGALLACGFSPADIDRAFQLPETTACQYRKQYFRQRNLAITPKSRDAILAAYFRNKSVSALTHMTGDKLASAGAGELAKVAAVLSDRAQRLEADASGQDQARVISAALSRLSGAKVPTKQINTTDNS